jgi:hypothetical protein
LGVQFYIEMLGVGDAPGQDPELLLEKLAVLLAPGKVFHSYESIICVVYFNPHCIVNWHCKDRALKENTATTQLMVYSA